VLEGIPAARRGVPQIEVTFDIDANGIVNVSAKDKGTGKEQKVTITSSGGLSKEEVERMVNEAKSHEAEDKKMREAIEKRNKLDGLILDIEKTLSENKEKIDATEATKVEEAIATAKTVLKEHENDSEKLQKATDDLLAASYKIAEMMYKKDGGTDGSAGSSDNNSAANDQGPIDAEIQE